MSGPAVASETRVAHGSGPARGSVWPLAVGGALVAVELAWVALLAWAALAIFR